MKHLTCLGHGLGGGRDTPGQSALMDSVSLALRQSISKWCVRDCFQIYDYFHPPNAELKKKKSKNQKNSKEVGLA